MLPTAQSGQTLCLVDQGTTVRDPNLLEGRFGIPPSKETVTDASVEARRRCHDASVGRQDTDVLMMRDRTSARTLEQNFRDSSVRKKGAKKTLTGRFLPRWEKSIRCGATNAARALNNIHSGSIFANKYRVVDEMMDGEQRVCRAIHISTGNKVFLHFYDDVRTLKAAEIHHRSITSAEICKWIETVDDVTDCLPFLVFEGGEYTFDQWLARPGRLFAEKRSALRKILRALVVIHEKGRANGNLAANRIVWFPAARVWKVLDLRLEDTHKSERLPSSSVVAKYAAPEKLLSAYRREKNMATDAASDMWSFGAMILEVIDPGESLYCFGASSNADGRVALSRQISLRLANVPGEHAYTLLRNLLQIDPIKRCTASQALRSAFFRTPDRPRTSSIPQNESPCVLSPGVMDTARRISLELPPATAVRTSISIEYFRRESNSSDTFHCRSGKEAYTITDAILPGHSIFLLPAGQNFRLRIRHEYDTASNPPPLRNKTVYARVDEGEYVKLDTKVKMRRQRSLDVVALIEPARLQSPRLFIPTMSTAGLFERYVKLDVVMDADVGRLEERQHVIYCKILPRTSRLRYHRFREKCSEVWNICRSLMRREYG